MGNLLAGVFKCLLVKVISGLKEDTDRQMKPGEEFQQHRGNGHQNGERINIMLEKVNDIEEKFRQGIEIMEKQLQCWK